MLESSDQNWWSAVAQSKAIRATRFGRPDDTSLQKTQRLFNRKKRNTAQLSKKRSWNMKSSFTAS